VVQQSAALTWLLVNWTGRLNVDCRSRSRGYCSRALPNGDHKGITRGEF
jgi:hypothetical protein